MTKVIELFFFTAALISALATSAMFLFMLYLGLPFITEGHFFELTTSLWQPEKGQYGIYPMLLSSLSVSLLATLISFPLSLGTACLITILAPRIIRTVLRRIVRFMSGIPTVIYGFVAIFLLVPFMREYITGGSGMNLMTAGLVLSVLIAPTMIIFFSDSLERIPTGYVMAADALGASKVQKILYVLVPGAMSGITSGVLMGFGRAMGDTLISLMVAGNSVAVPASLYSSARTLTAHIALVVAADFASMEFRSVFACGIFLYLLTAVLTMSLRCFSARASLFD